MKVKTFLTQLLKVGFLSILTIILLVGAVSYSLKNKKVEKVYAGSGDNVTGFAWSENIGWISFNSSNCDTDNDGYSNGGTGCPAVGTAIPFYGVNILDEGGIGKLSGYAWSENIGWISFNRADTIGIPPAGSGGYNPGDIYGVLAYTDSANKLQGWARALTACDDNSDGDCADVGEDNAADNAGGWDGWIRFTNTSAPAYGVTLTPGSPNGLFSGYAWGSDVLGWISFNSTNCDSNSDGTTDTGNYSNCPVGQSISPYAVSTTFELNLAPNAPSGLSVTEQYCNGRLIFSWTFTDPNLSPSLNQQRGYEIKAAYDPDIPSTIISSSSAGSSSNATVPLSDLTTKLGSSWYGKKLKWQVKVWDNATDGNGSNPKSATSSVRTESSNLSSREYPLVDFSWNPTKIFALQDVNFLDGSTCYSSGNTPVASCSAWSWNIPNANYQQSTTSIDQNPIVQFPSPANINASLTATDGGTPAYSCTAQKPISVNLPLPKIEEKK